MKIWIYSAAIVLSIFLLLFFGLGLHRKPRWIRNFEEDEYGREQSFLHPAAVIDGLAVYRRGAGLLANRDVGHAAQRWKGESGPAQTPAESHGTGDALQ
jgi:hypothetical protein